MFRVSHDPLQILRYACAPRRCFMVFSYPAPQTVPSVSSPESESARQQVGGRLIGQLAFFAKASYEYLHDTLIALHRVGERRALEPRGSPLSRRPSINARAGFANLAQQSLELKHQAAARLGSTCRKNEDVHVATSIASDSSVK